MSGYSILETPIRYPEPATRYLLVEDEPATGFEVVAICNSVDEAEHAYDLLTGTEAAS